MAQRLERSRDYDIVLWGATGFTGRLVAEALVAGLPETGARIALAGRSRERLENLRGELSAVAPDAIDPPLIVADSHDRPSLDAMTASARVVCSTVGPYAKHGAELVASCVEQRADYCDLTGEVHFIRAMIDRHHTDARARGIRIVHCCGFDSIPSDLGTWMLQEAAIERYGSPLGEVTFVLGASRGGFSGGTVASLVNVLDEARSDPDTRRVLTDPYALNPDGERSGPDGPDLARPRFDRDLQRWTGPFIMAAINTRVVRRTNALLGWRWGRDFRYREVTGFAAGIAGRLAATATAVGLGGLIGALQWSPTRTLLEKMLLPSPGDGPSRQTRERGFFNVTLHGRGRQSDDKPIALEGRVRGNRDPGYGETATMLAESALCLALDRDRLTSDGGVLTPAVAMAPRLLDRLRRRKMVFDVS